MADTDVRRIAGDLWRSLDFGLGSEAGLSVDIDAYRAARDLESSVTDLPESRRDYKGRALDLVAPSVWHALCYLVVTLVLLRVKNSTFDNPDEVDELFGIHGVYRGQARGWNIIPSGWRLPDQIADNEKRLDILSTYWKQWASSENDLAFDLFGRIDDRDAATAIAQHYGLPTSFVDFTFDPRIAMWFACSDSGGEPPAHLPSNLRNCAVVYFTSFKKLVNVGKTQFRTPHPAAARIYRQSGCFVDYGEIPKSIPPVLDFTQQWMWPQENCFRLFFPREYPHDESLQRVEQKWIYAPDPFFEESVQIVRNLSTKEIENCDSASRLLASQVKSKPSWRVKDDPLSIFYTDEEFFQLVRPLEHYLRVASLVETKAGSKLDPYVLGYIRQTNLDAARALQSVAKFRYTHSRGVTWMSERIDESDKLLDRYIKEHKDQSESRQEENPPVSE